MDLLINPEKWMEMPVSTVAAAMTQQGVGKLQLAVDKGGKALFALVVISGENTKVLLDALAAKEDELDAEGQGVPDMIMSEIVEWHEAAREKPDADITVMIIAGGDVEAYPGWWDGEQWRSADGMPCANVIYWTDMLEGPLA